jgi:2-polyprenyl-3-methyl-5-hydroxy-6-metoxy-1,4-benzoquinol methylase
MPATPESERYYAGLNNKLLANIPPFKRKVLELGCAAGRLGEKYKSENPHTEWHGIDISMSALSEANQVLDATYLINLDQDYDLSRILSQRDFDAIVIGDLIEHLVNPEPLLESLHQITTSDAELICCIPNMSNAEVIQRMLCGDLSYDDMGLLDKTHLRFYSPSSAIKLLLDSGWLPNIKDHYTTELSGNTFSEYLVKAAMELGIPSHTARRNLTIYQSVIHAKKWAQKPSLGSPTNCNFSVIVPTTKSWQLNLNIARSPGLKEIGAEILTVQNAKSAQEAWTLGVQNTQTPWVMICHQDVYFPRGSGIAICNELAKIENMGLAGIPIGFAGLSSNKNSPSGMVNDRGHQMDYPETSAASSLDELAIMLHRNSKIEIDGRLGWHLWATDLCLQLEEISGQAMARVINVPLFHNSVNDYSLPNEYHTSANHLLAKHPGHLSINTLCGELSRN